MRRPGATPTTGNRLRRDRGGIARPPLLRLPTEPPCTAALLPAPLQPAAAKIAASLLLAKFFMASIADVIDHRVACGNRRPLPRLDCGDELRSSRLPRGN